MVVMNKIDNEELKNIDGGLSITSTILNSITSIFKVLMDAGREIGSSIRRIHEDKMCPLE